MFGKHLWHKPHLREGLNPQRLRPELLSGIALHEQHTGPSLMPQTPIRAHADGRSGNIVYNELF